jgi:hypothetical protein
MTTEVLGSLSFLEQPSVNGIGVLLDFGNTPGIETDIAANLPVAGNTGRLFIDTTNSLILRDNGTSWDTLSPVISYTGTANQIDITGDVVSIVSNPIFPGTGGAVLPTGTTAQRGSSTAGNIRWNSTLVSEEIYDGTAWRRPGSLISWQNSTISAQTFTNPRIPLDSTIPQIGEGSQIWTASFTPSSPLSTVVVTITLLVAHSATGASILSLFVNGAANAVAVAAAGITTANVGQSLKLRYTFVPGSTAAITFTARIGHSVNGTQYVNQYATSTLGGVIANGNRVKIEEII